MIIILCCSLTFVFVLILRAYRQGFFKVFKRLAVMFAALFIAGLAIRLGAAFAPKMQPFISLVAGSVALFFYLTLNAVLKRSQESRYNYIPMSFRRLACLLALLESWLALSFFLFYLNYFYPLEGPPLFQKIFKILLLPIQMLWF